MRVMGQPLIMAPPSSTALVNIEESQVVSASALFNMMHNLGGYLDIVALATLLTHREQFHPIAWGIVFLCMISKLSNGLSRRSPRSAI